MNLKLAYLQHPPSSPGVAGRYYGCPWLPNRSLAAHGPRRFPERVTLLTLRTQDWETARERDAQLRLVA
jgi:hypothetical protein